MSRQADLVDDELVGETWSEYDGDESLYGRVISRKFSDTYSKEDGRGTSEGNEGVYLDLRVRKGRTLVWIEIG